MLEQVKILTSRRAYEFSPDALRLSSLSIQPVQHQIQQLFNFQSSAIGTPIATFGEVPSTFPPGIVFNIGAWIHQEEHIVPVRFLHFEQNRIVIDIAGPTVAIDGIADRLFHFLSGLRAADGSEVVGEPVRILDYSEITAQFSYPLDTLFARPLRRIFSKMVSRGVDDLSMTLVPIIGIQAFPSDEVLPGMQITNDPRAFTFSLRSGTRPEENIYFSTAPLDSEAHLAYLEHLATSLKP
ncbi:MAG: hypothetical protein ABI406_03505 [Ktedonobacteraceae bacterium]